MSKSVNNKSFYNLRLDLETLVSMEPYFLALLDIKPRTTPIQSQSHLTIALSKINEQINKAL